MRLVADLSSWLGERGLGAGDLGDGGDRGVLHGGGGRRCQRVSPRSLSAIVAYLYSLGVIPRETSPGSVARGPKPSCSKPLASGVSPSGG
jgi:hypothetical protein